MAEKSENKLEKIVSLCKRRGFIFPGSEIYGGLSGFYDYGPLGNELQFNIKHAWWNDVVRKNDNIVGLKADIIMNPRTWESSGHVLGFSDPMVECKKCHLRFRPDLLEDKKCPNCGGKEFSEARQFNLMFKTFVGPVEDSASVAYLRPETAGGIFVNFKNVLDTMRVKVPFGIAQIGKAFRNEVNPKDYIFRTREFEQMELEYFVKPGTDDEWFKKWVADRMAWYESIGLKNIRKFQQPKEELAHYSKGTTDIEYEFPFGWKEIEGIANRTDFDLKAHSAGSGQDLLYTDPDTGEKFVPYVIEPSAGVDRIALAVLCDAFNEEKERVVLKLHSKLAPYKAAVFPLLKNKPELVEKARGVYMELRKHFNVAWDDRGNIGKRYYSQDEIGTPMCITIDFDTLNDDTVTVRDRDTMEQKRVHISELAGLIQKAIE
ncbi:MAG: glycine--tRNA ligase [Candidatus Yanofskybacteria bacterium RIFCSPLOWO2_01_FULL_49_17]|uniref:Glycine--tRNA ligase n=1 Tax=Candidatus Yanofskybacteria bacterium RIFCSPLOWO2_01_FULL_49_17 TaxID=1802700 RepID=A0A1F8GRK7_9BACT|nr:MAG: glycine--tRNA ligase [Candidatus Yanofskybacteria bacterium RIFCSPLOWO2_01_FULL_49_17]